MKQLVCEMCGSNNVVKDGDVYVCQDCGTKYTPEAAKKMMVEVEGKVDVSGSKVKIDNTDEIESILALARRSFKSNNYENAEKYYAQVAVKDPNNWEAYYYSEYCQAMCGTIGSIAADCDRLRSALQETMQIILKNETPEECERIIVEELSPTITYIANIFYSNAQQHYAKFLGKTGITDVTPGNEFIERKKESVFLLINHGLWALTVCPDSAKVKQSISDVFKIALSFASKGGLKDFNIMNDISDDAINKMRALIAEVDPSYETPQKSSSGCYVATCVYGSYDCPQVWTLRRYRDNKLSSTWHGRLFIKLYYAISPTCVKWFGETKWFKKFWKAKLDRFVERLREEGYEDTPYND